MEDETTAEAGGRTDIVERSAGGEGALSVRAAASVLVDTQRENNDNNEPAGQARDRA